MQITVCTGIDACQGEQFWKPQGCASYPLRSLSTCLRSILDSHGTSKLHRLSPVPLIIPTLPTIERLLAYPSPLVVTTPFAPPHTHLKQPIWDLPMLLFHPPPHRQLYKHLLLTLQPQLRCFPYPILNPVAQKGACKSSQ
jgi:hypothetical protein